MDGHFKLPQKIILDDGRRARVMIAVLGCNGFLLRDVSIAQSESTEAYINAISPILAAIRIRSPTAAHYFRQPWDDTGEIHAMIRDIWGDGVHFVLAGDPVHRKIEFQESVDKTHQDAAAAISDMAYIIKRFGNLIREEDGVDTKSQMSNLLLHVEFLLRRRGNIANDPFSYAFAKKYNRRARNRNKRAHLLNMFRGHMKDVSALPAFRESHAVILTDYYATCHLRRSLPSTLREILVDYHRSPVLLDGAIIPSGAVYRIICAEDAGAPENARGSGGILSMTTSQRILGTSI